MADVSLSKLKPNTANPRTIKDARYKQLLKSLKEFPKMLELRPIIIDKTGKVLAGNMKLRGLLELGYETVPQAWVRKASDLTEEERSRFIVMDNEHAGENDWQKLASEWDQDLLKDWGLKMPAFDDGKTPVTFAARKVKKGCKVIIITEQEEEATTLANRLIQEGFKVEVK